MKCTEYSGNTTRGFATFIFLVCAHNCLVLLTFTKAVIQVQYCTEKSTSTSVDVTRRGTVSSTPSFATLPNTPPPSSCPTNNKRNTYNQPIPCYVAYSQPGWHNARTAVLESRKRCSRYRQVSSLESLPSASWRSSHTPALLYPQEHVLAVP